MSFLWNLISAGEGGNSGKSKSSKSGINSSFSIINTLDHIKHICYSFYDMRSIKLIADLYKLLLTSGVCEVFTPQCCYSRGVAYFF